MKRVIFCLISIGSLFAIPIKAKDFSYLKEKMPKMNSTLLDIHLRLYEGYVAQVNFIDSEINKQNDPFMLQALRKQYGFEYDGMVLHELYFESLGGKGNYLSIFRILEKIKSEYGSIEKFKDKVKSFAKTRGIGWVILFAKINGGDIKLSWVGEHEKGFLAGYIPVFVVDLWEHAYISQFGLDKTAYVDLIFQYTNWKVVNERYVCGCNELKNTYRKIN